jgi:hypothetical protein
MSEEQWLEAQRNLEWAEELWDATLRRILRTIALDWVDASVTLRMPEDCAFRTNARPDPS